MCEVGEHGLRALTERTKELRFLHEILALPCDGRASLDEALADLVERLPTAWLHAKDAWARVLLDDRQFATENYHASDWTLRAPILLAGTLAGQVEVGYLAPHPPEHEGPFLLEERWLIDSVARYVGNLVDRHRSEAELLDSIQRLEDSNLQLRATEQQLRATEQQLRANEQQLRTYNQQLEEGNQTLRRAEERFRSYMDHAPYGVFICDREGRYQHVNPAAERVTGYGRDELLSMSIPDLLTPEDRAPGLGDFQRLLSDGHLETELGLLHKSGEQRRWTVSAVRLSDERFLGFTQDVTARARAEREREAALADLSRRTRALEGLLEGARQVLTNGDFEHVARRIFDVARELTGARSGYVALLNETGEENELLFLEAGGVPCTVDPELPMPVRGLRAEAYRSGQVALDNDFMGGPWAHFMPAGHATLDNVLFAPLVIEERTVGIIGLANKPTAFDADDETVAAALGQLATLALQKWRGEQALKEREEKYRVLADNTLDVIWTMDLDLVFRYVNPAIRQMTGYEPEEWVGSRLSDHCDEAAFARMDSIIGGALQAGPEGGGAVFRTTMRRKDGRPVAVEIHGTVIFGPDGSPSFIQGVTRDITERQELQTRLAQADRLSSMGTLAAGVAHEINNPLSYVLLNLESLAQDLPGILQALRHLGAAEDIEVRFDDALAGARRIREIVHGLGAFSRVEKERRGPVHLSQALDVAAAMAANEIRFRARLIKDYAPLPPILGSEGRLCQVFLNLLINATHAIDEGDQENNEIHVRTWGDGDFAFVEVRDTGVGISPDHLSKVFEPFFSTKKIGQGSGLGLAISKSIVEAHGGRIEAHSELGVGTRVTVALPFGSQEMERGGDAGKAQEAIPRVSGRILIVDDEAGIRDALARMLRAHEVVLADDGARAVEILSSRQDFDLILCDMMMPNLSGVDLHEWLVATHPKLATRLVFMTGGAFTPRAREYLAETGNACVEKPFDAARLRTLVDERLSEAREVRRDQT